MVKVIGFLVLLTLPFMLVACGGANPPPDNNDTIVPSIKSVSPLDGSSTIAINTNLVFTFSETMNQPASEGAISSTPAITCAFRWNAEGDLLTCDPSNNLAVSTTYNVIVGAGAKDLAGNALANTFSFRFTTGTKALETCKFNDVTTVLNDCAFGS